MKRRKLNINYLLIPKPPVNFVLTLIQREEEIMKKLKFLIAFVMIGFLTNAQDLTEANGLYYLNSQLASGDIVTYYENDLVKMEMKVTNGMKDGEIRIYFENGTLNEIRGYKDNQMDGLWITYNKAGIKVAEANFKNGKKHGVWKIYSNEGALVYEMYYQNGEKTGIWKKFNTNGEIISTKTYNELYNIKKDNEADAYVFAS